MLGVEKLQECVDYVDSDDWEIKRAAQIKYFNSSIRIYFPKERVNLVNIL